MGLVALELYSINVMLTKEYGDSPFPVYLLDPLFEWFLKSDHMVYHGWLWAKSKMSKTGR